MKLSFLFTFSGLLQLIIVLWKQIAIRVFIPPSSPIFDLKGSPRQSKLTDNRSKTTRWWITGSNLMEKNQRSSSKDKKPVWEEQVRSYIRAWRHPVYDPCTSLVSPRIRSVYVTCITPYTIRVRHLYGSPRIRSVYVTCTGGRYLTDDISHTVRTICSRLQYNGSGVSSQNQDFVSQIWFPEAWIVASVPPQIGRPIKPVPLTLILHS